jgi:hypothetical protein
VAPGTCQSMRDHMAQNGRPLKAEFSEEAVTAQLLEAYQRFARRRAPVGDECAVAQ